MKKFLPALALATAACMESAPRSADTVAPRTAPVVTSVRVNHGTYGMISRLRWMISPDSLSMMAMVDPAGVEAEALPNGFFYGSESRNLQVRMDSVWDAAPSPDWSMIAFSRAYVLNPGGADSIPVEMWQELARKTGIDTATVRTGSFASSGMSLARAIAQPGTIRLPADGRATGAGDGAVPKMYPFTIGWRVRWTGDGKLVALGNSPAMVQDDQPSENWASLDPATGAFHPTLPAGATPPATAWVTGPVLEIGAPADIQGGPAFSIVTGNRRLSIESARGVITAREAGRASDSTGRNYTIGSGKALAVTKGGRYILALAPRTNAVANEVPVEAIVYVVGW
ncbi:MAG: hypothetical protein ABIS03_14485 [Gemmatimonadaceae bacterium]